MADLFLFQTEVVIPDTRPTYYILELGSARIAVSIKSRLEQGHLEGSDVDSIANYNT